MRNEVKGKIFIIKSFHHGTYDMQIMQKSIYTKLLQIFKRNNFSMLLDSSNTII